MTRAASDRGKVRRGLLLIGGLCLSACGAAACQKVEAKTPGPAPIALEVPEPPIRLQIPVSADPPQPPPPATEKPPVPNTPATRPRPTPTPTPTPPVTPPTSSSTAETPPPVVQTGGQQEQETKARDRLAEAQRDLAKLQPKLLGRDALAQYQSAQRFIKLTTDALKAKNFVYALACAEKAATLAALLVKG